MSIETLLVAMAMGITLITGLAIRSAMRGRPGRTSSDGSPSAYATDAAGGGFSYSGSNDGSSGGDNCDTPDSGGSDSGGCDSGGGGDGGGSSD